MIGSPLRIRFSFLRLSDHTYTNCHADESTMQAMGPRTRSSTMATRYTYNREDGRFFAALRMTCAVMSISEMCR